MWPSGPLSMPRPPLPSLPTGDHVLKRVRLLFNGVAGKSPRAVVLRQCRVAALASNDATGILRSSALSPISQIDGPNRTDRLQTIADADESRKQNLERESVVEAKINDYLFPNSILTTPQQYKAFMEKFQHMADKLAPMFGQFRGFAIDDPRRFAKDMFEKLGPPGAPLTGSSDFHNAANFIFNILKTFLAEPANCKIYGENQNMIWCGTRAVMIAAALRETYPNLFFTGYRAYYNIYKKRIDGHIWVQLYMPAAADNPLEINENELPLELDGFREHGEATPFEIKLRNTNGLGYTEQVRF